MQNPSRLKDLLERLKLPIELLALLVGVLLGATSLWQQLRPTPTLVADILETPALLPAELLEDARALPTKATETLLKDEALQKLIPSAPLREDLRPVITTVLGRYAEGIHSPWRLQEKLIVCTVRNTGSTTLSAVQLSFPNWINGHVTLRGADGTTTVQTTKGLIDVGELRPGASMEVFAWGMGLLSLDSARLTHKDGLGAIQVARPVPRLVSENGGVFISYRHATLFLLAVIIAGAALLALSKRPARLSAASPTGKDAG